MTYDIRAKLYLDNADYEKKLRRASKQTESYGKSMKTISNGVKTAWAGIAGVIGGQVVTGLIDMAKAADEDKRSMALLNKVLENSWKATDKQTKSVDDFIQRTSVQVGILDDDLRPAFAKIATTIKSPTKAMEVFGIALDTAAGTGKDLNVVSLAMAKFFGGQTSALDKLVPGIRDAGDKMAYLTSKYQGAGAAGATAFSKIDVAMENIKEQFGAYLLPYAEKFATWLSTPEAQQAIDNWITKFGKLLDITEDIINGIVYYTSDARGKAMIRQQQSQEKWRPIQESRRRSLGGTYQDAQKGLAQNMPVNITINAPNTSGTAVLDALKKTARRKGVPLRLLVD
jgi:uncharacterized protein YukE